MTNSKQYKRITVKSLVEMKSNMEKISMLTAYDYTTLTVLELMLYWLETPQVMSWQDMKPPFQLHWTK